MKESPIQATIGFVIDILGLRPENFDGAIETPAVISDIPGIEDLPPNVIDVPEGGFGIFPLPPSNPNYTPPFSSPFFHHHLNLLTQMTEIKTAFPMILMLYSDRA